MFNVQHQKGNIDISLYNSMCVFNIQYRCTSNDIHCTNPFEYSMSSIKKATLIFAVRICVYVQYAISMYKLDIH